MCGIGGIMMVDGSIPPALLIDRLEAGLAHRGPDGSGRHVGPGIALIQTRLAIIDLVSGDQPLYEEGGAVLVGNGEIYNYLELKAHLPTAPFKTNSDCEVPLILYRQLGLDFIRHLRGMYALAIYDPVTDRLILSRDPFGIKPLYYCETSGAFLFASEPEALLATGLIAPDLSRQVRNELLQLQFTTGSETIYAGIRRVMPGETLVIAQGRVIETQTRAALPEGPTRPYTEQQALLELDELLRDTMRVHLRSDVPYGLFLSGGIDSASLLALMRGLSDRPVEAFTIGFPGTDAADERMVARKIAAACGAHHHEVDLREADFWHLLPKIAQVMDDPAADYAILPTYKLAATAQQAGLKVILSGEGGDELFGGYGRYRSAMRPWWAGRKKLRARGNLDGLGILRGHLTGWRNGMVAAEGVSATPGRSRLQIAQAIDCADWLPNDLLTKLDRCLMAHGIEGRTPFLDPRVADFAMRLPDDLKVRERVGKWILRRWVHDRLPELNAFGKKQGLTVPVGAWMKKRGGLLGPLVARQPGIREICLPDRVETLFRTMDEKRHGFAAWTLLFYALWHRAHIRHLPPERDVFQTLSLQD